MATRLHLGRNVGVVAHNRCCRCRHEWHDKPVGFARHQACPACGSAYWQWLDYAQGRKKSASSASA